MEGPSDPAEEDDDTALQQRCFEEYVLARNAVVLYLNTANIAWRFFGIRITFKLIASAVHGLVQLGGVAIMIKVRTDFIGDRMNAAASIDKAARRLPGFDVSVYCGCECVQSGWLNGPVLAGQKDLLASRGY